MFTAKNEIANFSYEDSVIRKIEQSKGQLTLVVEALLVLPANSQNTNYTKSYADLVTVTFSEAEIKKGVKEGYKRYDANDKLMEEVPDTLLSAEETQDVLKKAVDQYLYDIKEAEEEQGRKEVVLGIEMTTDDLTGIDADSYQVLVECRDVTFSWERYLNRAESR